MRLDLGGKKGEAWSPLRGSCFSRDLAPQYASDNQVTFHIQK